jgi:hypothetical protein
MFCEIDIIFAQNNIYPKSETKYECLLPIGQFASKDKFCACVVITGTN